MKTRICAVVLFGVVAATFAQAQSDPAVKQEIVPLLQEKLAAANAHDTDRFLAKDLHDPKLVLVINGRVIRGFDKVREQQLKWWNAGKSDVVYAEKAPPDFRRLGKKSVLVTQYLTSHRTLPDGSKREGEFVVSSVWERFPSGWRVTYSHESAAIPSAPAK